MMYLLKIHTTSHNHTETIWHFVNELIQDLAKQLLGVPSCHITTAPLCHCFDLLPNAKPYYPRDPSTSPACLDRPGSWRQDSQCPRVLTDGNNAQRIKYHLLVRKRCFCDKPSLLEIKNRLELNSTFSCPTLRLVIPIPPTVHIYI